MKSLLSALLVVSFVQFSLSAPTTPMVPETASIDPKTASTDPKQRAKEGRLEQLLRTFGMSPCVSACMFELNTDFVYREDGQTADLKQVCDSYTRASQCFKSCPEVDQRLFDVTSSGIHYMCVEKRAEFEKAQPCLNEQRDSMKKECNQKCASDAQQQMPPSHSDVDASSSHSHNSSDVFERLSLLCVVLRCSVNCGRELLNNKCDRDQHVGDLVTEVMLRPLEQNAVILDKSPPEVKEYVSHALPDTCAYTIDVKQLDALRRGDLQQEDPQLAAMEPFKSDDPLRSEIPSSSSPINSV